jgi:O-acetylhomoserine (thiol)-lyase
LPENPTYEIAKALFPNGAGSMLCFGVKGGREGGAAFINALKLSSNLANVGDSRTLVLHPASTTHSRLDDEAMKASGTSPDLIRVSVGIESVSDIINDFKIGLKAVEKATS